MASVTVQTFLTGANPCQLTSSGAPIQCVSGTPGTPPNAVASGSASAGPGSLSLSLAVGGTGGNAMASAAASYNYELIFPGAASGTLAGRYTANASAAGNLGVFGNISLSQGNTTAVVPIQEPVPPPGIPNPLVLTSIYVAGQPLMISGNISAEVSTPGQETATGSAQLIGFFDSAGNPVPFTVVPEPAPWPVLGLCLVLVWRGKRIR